MATASEILATIPLFSMLEPKELSKLAATAHAAGYKAGTVLTDQQDFGSAFFVVVDGDLTVTVGDQVRRRLGSGDHFGEMALVDRSPRSATVVADTDVRCLVFMARTFRPFAMAHPEVTWALLEVMVQRLRDAERP